MSTATYYHSSRSIGWFNSGAAIHRKVEQMKPSDLIVALQNLKITHIYVPFLVDTGFNQKKKKKTGFEATAD